VEATLHQCQNPLFTGHGQTRGSFVMSDTNAIQGTFTPTHDVHLDV